MNLQEFIRDSLKQIMAGVSEASTDTRIAPQIVIGDEDKVTLRTFQGYNAVFLVDFDVAVTAADTSMTGGGGGITVLPVATLQAEISRPPRLHRSVELHSEFLSYS